MDEDELSDEDIINRVKMVVIVVSLVVFSLFLYFQFVNPIIKVYQAKKAGEAELAQADSNRKIQIKEAEAHQQSAKFLAQSEIIRAEGVAEANRIIGDSLKGNDSYLRYLWIQGLQTNQMQTVYIPTEAGLPILEANPNIQTGNR